MTCPSQHTPQCNHKLQSSASTAGRGHESFELACISLIDVKNQESSTALCEPILRFYQDSADRAIKTEFSAQLLTMALTLKP